MKYNIIRLKSRIQAKKMQKEFKKLYGYRPSLFEEHIGKKIIFKIIKPRGLEKI